MEVWGSGVAGGGVVEGWMKGMSVCVWTVNWRCAEYRIELNIDTYLHVLGTREFVPYTLYLVR